ncbi:MAG: Stk1 family PASTA domain-containing Ser/Thr kinase [Clostridiales bacterium]|jgi:serine/threonine-protein kinase|nr:Stk1 family PASTA domain-containing Ser/Thr kinase [Clostridiales bacterium]
MILKIGTVISGRYEILDQIGSGGMSHVYRALDTKLQRSVTFKVLREEYISDANFLTRFDTEARAVASLNHANIVNVYDVGNEGNIKYIVMEYVHGKTLKELIQEQAPFSNDVMLGVAEQITAALIHAHENGIIHKDIKPQNILVMPNGAVKVADFGIADDKNSRKLVEDGSTMGSVHYISPEAACNDIVDARSDLYSLGITMFEMMTGELPFDSDDPDEIPALHMGAPFPNIIKKNPEILPLVREIIAKLTHKVPNRRYQSANSLYRDIQRAIMECAKYRQYEDTRKTEYTGSRFKNIDNDDFPKPAPRARPAGRPPKSPAEIRRERLFIAGGVGAAAVVIVLLILGINWISGLFGNGNEGYVHVPAVIGRDISWVEQELTALGVEFDVLEDYSETVPAGMVISSNLQGAGDWDLNVLIQLVVSRGVEGAATIRVPDIEGMPLAQITEMFMNLEIYLDEEDPVFHPNVPENHVIMQNPQAGTLVPPGTIIYITLSLGPQTQMSLMPNLVALTETQARSAVLDANLVVGSVTAEESDVVPRGSVIRQIPAAGTQLHPGSSVDFVISDGVLPPDPTAPTEPTEPPTTEPPTEPDDYPENGDNGDNGEDLPPENGEEPPTEPPENGEDDPPPPVATTRNLSLNPPISAGETVELRFYRVVDGNWQFEQGREATEDDLPWNITVSGIGTVDFVLTVNGAELWQEVTFD